MLVWQTHYWLNCVPSPFCLYVKKSSQQREAYLVHCGTSVQSQCQRSAAICTPREPPRCKTHPHLKTLELPWGSEMFPFGKTWVSETISTFSLSLQPSKARHISTDFKATEREIPGRMRPTQARLQPKKPKTWEKKASIATGRETTMGRCPRSWNS